jgi:small GTP-binding protein
MTDRAITVALAGNPNSGKTTVFNNLTGARQHVGNWPGVTVEKKQGSCKYKGRRINVVDLPGVYSLTAYSLDEVIARDYIVEGKPDVVVDIVDASNLERNLYLAVQFLEMQVRLVIALNMMDVAQSRGYQINVPELSRLLGTPVVPMVAARNEGTDKLMETIAGVADGDIPAGGIDMKYGRDVEEEISKLTEQIKGLPRVAHYSPRWLAVKLLEDDEEIIEKIKKT